MTRYFLFEYDDYYPCGGFDDLTGIFESESDVLATIKNKDMWEDNIDIYSLENDSTEPEFLYRRFTALDKSGNAWLVIGNSVAKIIKLVGREIGKVHYFPGSYIKMSDCKIEEES